MDGQDPQQTDSQGGHRIISNPAPLPAPCRGQFQLISPQRSSLVGRQGGWVAGMSLPAPTMPTTPRIVCATLSLLSNHSNTLPWLGTVTTGYLLILTRTLPLTTERTEAREDRHVPGVTQQSQVWAPQPPGAGSSTPHGAEDTPGVRRRDPETIRSTPLTTQMRQRHREELSPWAS